MSRPGHYSWLEALPIVPDFQFKMIVFSFQPDPYLTGLCVAGDVGEGFIEDAEEMVAGIRRGCGIP